MRNPSQNSRRSGLTLIEMLVSVFLLVMLMTILVTIFASATGSIQEQRAYAGIDMELRRIDATIRLDLQGSTAKMTPPNYPGDNTGYFEYGENALCDAQGEDSDDTLRFTVKAPDGKPFTGRMWVPRSVPPTDPGYMTSRRMTLVPVTTTSTYAEVIYFLRNGNLYRRVQLIKPELTGRLHAGNLPNYDPPIPPDGTPPFVPPSRTDIPNSPGRPRIGFAVDIFQPRSVFSYLANGPGGPPITSWSAVNDISAVPSDYPGAWATANNVTPDMLPLWGQNGYGPRPTTLGMLTDRHNRAFNPRFVDDFVNDAQTIANGSPVFLPDGIPDDLNSDGVPDYYPTLYPNAVTAGFLNERDTAGVPLPPGGARPGLTVNFDVLAFPYLFPQAYSVPDPNTTGVGWIHSLDPSVVPAPFAGRPYFGTYLDPPFNHNPLDIGDSEYRFANDPNPPARLPQTWWGFPTWRESAAPYWFGPIRRLNDPPGARYFTSLPPGADPTAETGAGAFTQTSLLSWVRRFGSGPILPPQVDQLYNDGTGGPYFQMPPNAVWEDDLLATNVRSFDVKAYDPAAKMVVGGVVVALPSDYYDLGYANLWGPGAMGLAAGVATPPGMLDSFGHEGRMPPLLEDYRSDAQYPELVPNIGDDNNTVIRMRRVWDSWSTTYTHAPALAVDPNTDPRSGARPVYLSYPAPYPAPLRGIQIRIRITDADGKRVKNLTIRHDFSDKL